MRPSFRTGNGGPTIHPPSQSETENHCRLRVEKRPLVRFSTHDDLKKEEFVEDRSGSGKLCLSGVHVVQKSILKDLAAETSTGDSARVAGRRTKILKIIDST
ncbi:hypothetical protein TNIN_409991 [Trichonephila inaurata madagascariensis]|uniref:Uncharacterized protein n=1 Tax=Trichonephila inaurata madagascariensis TaxID=2747483 RepID=A0A8X6XDM2_9ARAC|nr:hypothetical protein TNIN_409991 [Trichonephila inaurata madagascariensis]